MKIKKRLKNSFLIALFAAAVIFLKYTVSVFLTFAYAVFAVWSA